jgi:flagellar basal body-associated protein FliL
MMMSTPLEISAPSRRSRIVVNLDEGQQAGGPRSARRSGASGGGRGRRILLILLVVFVAIVVAIAAGLFFWWQSYKTRPNYSLALVVDAAQRNDMTEFDKLVDTDKVVDNFLPQVLEKAGAQSSYGLPGGAMRKQLQAMLLKYAPQVKQRVREEVSGQVRELSARAEQKPFFLVALAMPFVVDTKQDGDAAKVNATLKDRPVELTMQRDGERWKIVGVKDDVLAARILESVARDLPANAATPQIPDELRKQVEKKLPGGKLPDIPIFTK